MAITPYSPSLQAFSNKGHLCAQRMIYPLIFPNSDLQFIPLPEEQAKTLDADMGMDRHVLVKVQNLRDSFQVMAQERFRRAKFASMRDVTVTEYNHNSRQPGELYKIKAEMFLYGYYDENADTFVEAIAFSMLNLKVNIAQGLIAHTTGLNTRSNQTFLCFKFDDLEKQHITVFRRRWDDTGRPVRNVNPYVSPDEGNQSARTRIYAAKGRRNESGA